MDYGEWTENSRGTYNKWDGIARTTTQVFFLSLYIFLYTCKESNATLTGFVNRLFIADSLMGYTFSEYSTYNASSIVSGMELLTPQHMYFWVLKTREKKRGKGKMYNIS